MAVFCLRGGERETWKTKPEAAREIPNANKRERGNHNNERGTIIFWQAVTYFPRFSVALFARALSCWSTFSSEITHATRLVRSSLALSLRIMLFKKGGRLLNYVSQTLLKTKHVVISFAKTTCLQGARTKNLCQKMILSFSWVRLFCQSAKSFCNRIWVTSFATLERKVTVKSVATPNSE